MGRGRGANTLEPPQKFSLPACPDTPTMLPQSFGRISTAGSTVRGLVSHAFFSTRDGSDMVVMIDGEKTFNDVVVSAAIGSGHFFPNDAFPSGRWGKPFREPAAFAVCWHSSRVARHPE
jgi:hypothetical protein